MGVVILIVLAAIWAAFLLPPILRARAEHRPSGSIGDFRRQLRVLAQAVPGGSVPMRYAPAPSSGHLRVVRGPVVSPRVVARRRALKRRRDVFFGLLVAMGGSLILGTLEPLRMLWYLHVVFDLAFAGYCALLISLRDRTTAELIDLRPRLMSAVEFPMAPEPALAIPLRRVAN